LTIQGHGQCWPRDTERKQKKPKQTTKKPKR